MVKNLKELFAKFSDEDTCRKFLVQQSWNGVPVCPYCGCNKSYNIENGKRFKCANKECYKKYSVTVGTVFEASNIPLTMWFPAMYLIASHKKGISSVQLAKDLGVTQKTAWFMLHRIRESLKEKGSPLLSGIVEADETYMSRKYGSDYKGLSDEQIEKLAEKRHSEKGAVLAIAERATGRVLTKAIPDKSGEHIKPFIKQHVVIGSELHTDEAKVYKKGLSEYVHKSVNHRANEWVVNGVTTNRVENFWSVMRRGIYGIYHQVSYKHLQRYCDEFAYRYNSRELKDGQRFSVVLQGLEGRLTYNQLVYGKSKKSEDKAEQTEG